jgi:hypothetical protein
MSETPPTATQPSMMPLLSRGRHRNPSSGACFMEYTALLAGEPFSDRPRCVDPKLAAILRGANDTLSDEDRSQLVSLLGRAIGLVVPPEAGEERTGRLLTRRGGRAPHREAVALTARLHALVSEKLRAAVAPPRSPARTRRYAGVSDTFWDLMGEPTRPRTEREYSTRLMERVELLHRCYEDALDELGLAAGTGRESTSTRAATTQVLLSTPLR